MECASLEDVDSLLLMRDAVMAMEVLVSCFIAISEKLIVALCARAKC